MTSFPLINRRATWATMTAALLFSLSDQLPIRAQTPPVLKEAVVDPSVQYQTWEGWGSSLAWWAKVVGGFPEAIRQDYMEKAFDPVKGLGLNIVRYNIGGGEAPAYLSPNKQFLSFRAAVPGYEPSPGKWNWTADANQRWVLQQAIRRGANQYEAFSNSPPAWMTVSGSVTGNHGGADNLKPESDTAFADYLTEVVRHFQTTWHLTFRDLEPLNEPSGRWGFGNAQEGCEVERPHQNALINAVAAALARKNIRAVSVTASDEPTIGDADRTFPVYDSAARRAIRKLNTHSYGGGDRVQLFNFANSAGQDLWLSEDGDGDASGLSLSEQIVTDVRGLHPSAWVYWQVVDNAGGWGFLKNPLDAESHTAYTINPKYYVMGQYSKFIRPGFRIIAITEAHSLAAYDARSQTLVVVTTNSGDTERTVRYNLSRFARLGPLVSTFRTSPTESLAQQPGFTVTKGQFSAALPAKSVTTFVIRGAADTSQKTFDFRDYYKFVNAGTGQTLGVADAAESESSVIEGKDTGSAGQQWGIIGIGNGEYQIVNRASGLLLDVIGASKLPGISLIQYGENGGPNQIWKITDMGNKGVSIVNKNSGLALNGTPKVTQQPADTNPGQRWILTRIKPND